MIDLGHDVHDLRIDGVALPGQLRDLLKQLRQPLLRRHLIVNQKRCSSGHNPIKAAPTDKNGLRAVHGR